VNDMAGHDIAEPYDVPSVTEPSRAQREALLARAERVGRVLPAGLGLAGLSGSVVAAPGPEWLPEAAPMGNGWAVAATWGQDGAWRLLLTSEAVSLVLAAQLGQDELADHCITDLDLRLLQLPVRALANELARELPAGGGTAGLALTHPPGPAGHEAVATWRVRLEHGGQGGEMLLAIAWEALSAMLAPPADETRLAREEVIGAPVLVEAMLAGPALTARELAEMEPGDVVALGAGEHTSVLRANGLPFARGRIGAKGARLAVNIQEIEPATEE